MSYRVIGASAGTGKTHRLTSHVIDALVTGAAGAAHDSSPESSLGLQPEGLCGVTFTKKAAAELDERLRTRLYALGKPELAQRLGMAYLGTVNSVGLRLIAEYAIEAGLSPEVGVLPEDGGRFLHALLERVLSDEQQRSLDALAWRLRIHFDAQRNVENWHKDVFEIVNFARMNRISPEALPAMAARAWQSYQAHFDPPADAAALDAAMQAAFDEAAVRYDAGDKTGYLKKFLDLAPGRRRDLAHDLWDVWAGLATVELGKLNYGRRDALRAAASRVLAHPRLHADVEAYLRETYAAAAAMLATFAEWKKAARVVDHTDQLDLAWQVLGREDLAADLAATLGMVVVDELQDSNPLQMALYTRLHPLAGRSVWVGDPKQCIFEWNGADPALVDVVLAAMKAAGGETDRLDVNRRSRPELVAFISELFASAFADHRMAPDDVRVSAFRQDPPALAALPPLGLAFFDPRAESLPGAAAARVAALLADPDATPVVDRRTGQVRPLVPGDIAVLLPSNAACQDLARELEAHGIRAATAQSGLLQTPEGWLVRAALGLVVAPDDAAAEADIEALIGRDGDLSAVLAQREAWLAARLAAVTGGDRSLGRWSTLLESVRRELPALSPSGVLERIYAVLDLPRRVLAWPDGAARCANLDALRRLVAGYESLETARTRPLTVSGLLRAMAAVLNDEKDMPLIDEQHVTASADAVQVMTYHKAKGLEWPVVILGGLDKSERRTAFEVACESDAATFSLEDPLASRWIRYWPWPFFPSRKGELFGRVEQSDFGRAVAQREKRERVRLLYVGFTRARDHLVLLVSDKDGDRGTQWLDELARGGTAAWRFTADPGQGLEVTGPDGAVLAVRTRLMGPPRVASSSAAAPVMALERPAQTTPRPRRDVSPSRVEEADLLRLGVRVWRPRGPIVTLGPPLAVQTPSGFTDWDRVGTAIHGFLAGDVATDDDRLGRAQAWSNSHGTVAKLAPATLVEAADRFEAWVAQRWPGATIMREIPIASVILDNRVPIASALAVDQATVGAARGHQIVRKISGVIDALVDTGAGWVVVDHKSFPAAGGVWKKAAELAPQLAIYAHALGCQAGARPVVGICLHFPIAGTIVELT